MVQQLRDNLRGSTRLLYDEFKAKKYPITIINAEASLLEYTDRCGGTHLLYSTCSDKSSAVGRTVAESKLRTAQMAAYLHISSPISTACHTIREARAFLAEHHRIVLKPLNGSGGRGVTTNIQTDESLAKAYAYARNYSRTIVAQQHIVGTDVRLLTIDGKFCSAVIRRPAHVVGDGHSTIAALINHANTSSPRHDPAFLSILPINIQAARRFLGETIHTSPAAGTRVRVVGPANVSLGGSLHEATHLVPPTMIADAEAISQKLKLGICGVDIMWNQKANKHYLIEVNATPGIDIHNDPASGTSSDCVEQYVAWLVT